MGLRYNSHPLEKPCNKFVSAEAAGRAGAGETTFFPPAVCTVMTVMSQYMTDVLLLPSDKFLAGTFFGAALLVLYTPVLFVNHSCGSGESSIEHQPPMFLHLTP